MKRRVHVSMLSGHKENTFVPTLEWRTHRQRSALDCVHKPCLRWEAAGEHSGTKAYFALGSLSTSKADAVPPTIH